MKTLLLLTVTVATITACAPTIERWAKPGAGESEFNQANYACQAQSSVILPHGGVAGTPRRHTDWDLYRMCMQAQGWAPSN